MKKDKAYTDAEIIDGIQQGDLETVRGFYLSCKSYFGERRRSVIDPLKGAHDEEDVFQDSFLRLWKEIQTRRFFVRDSLVWHIDCDGAESRMRASLKTYLMSIIRNRSHEVVKENAVYAAEAVNADKHAEAEPDDLTAEWIVDICVNSLPKRCKEILTLFYYEDKSLDEILMIRKENQSKDGLKTGKAKCMKSLKIKITEEFLRRNLKPYSYAQ